MYRECGPAASGLGGVHMAAMSSSHLLAKRVGAWPSVAAVTVVTLAAAEVVTRAGRTLAAGPAGGRSDGLR